MDQQTTQKNSSKSKVTLMGTMLEAVQLLDRPATAAQIMALTRELSPDSKESSMSANLSSMLKKGLIKAEPITGDFIGGSSSRYMYSAVDGAQLRKKTKGPAPRMLHRSKGPAVPVHAVVPIKLDVCCTQDGRTGTAESVDASVANVITTVDGKVLHIHIHIDVHVHHQDENDTKDLDAQNTDKQRNETELRE